MLHRSLTSCRLARLCLPGVNTSRLTHNLAEEEHAKELEESRADGFTLDPNWRKWWNGSYSKHPGKCALPAVSLPNNFIKSATAYLSECYELHPRNKVMSVSQKLCDVLAYRPLQMKSYQTQKETTRKGRAITKREMLDFFYGKTEEAIQHESSEKIKANLWKQIVYDRLNCAAYLIGRSPATYATTLRVLSEIKQRDPDFIPSSMLDYGSGVGTSVWAANNLWGKAVEDYFCVDSSGAMNELSQFLITGGRGDAEITGIYLRPMMPVSYKHSYDIVIAAYTLSELPSEKDRLTTLKILWEKTNKYLVIVEQGYQQGYHIVMEARNLITHGIEGADLNKESRKNSSIKTGHIFAPCPHDKVCPKWKMSPCSFKQSYFPPPYAKRFHEDDGAVKEAFSYIILSKEDPGLDSWPRAISEPQSFSDKVHCHFCSPSGQIEHLYLKRKTHGRDVRFTAKKTDGGDLFPLTPKT